MCVVSMVGDYYSQRTLPQVLPNWPMVLQQESPVVSREEFEALKKSVEELRILLLAAKKYDENLGEPHCEHEDKVKLIKQLAKIVGVDLSDVFDN